MNATNTTVREVLASLGLGDLPGLDEWGGAPASGSYRWACTNGTGNLQTNCGGDVILVIDRPIGRPVVLVRDEDAAHEWDRARANGTPMHVLGPKPHARLVLRQTA